jgi:hypothetical protein
VQVLDVGVVDGCRDLDFHGEDASIVGLDDEVDFVEGVAGANVTDRGQAVSDLPTPLLQPAAGRPGWTLPSR